MIAVPVVAVTNLVDDVVSGKGALVVKMKNLKCGTTTVPSTTGVSSASSAVVPPGMNRHP